MEFLQILDTADDRSLHGISGLQGHIQGIEHIFELIVQLFFPLTDTGLFLPSIKQERERDHNCERPQTLIKQIVDAHTDPRAFRRKSQPLSPLKMICIIICLHKIIPALSDLS